MIRSDKSYDRGMVDSVDEPEGVSWLFFEEVRPVPGSLDDQSVYLQNTVPVATSELNAAKSRYSVTSVSIGDRFWAKVNMGALSIADVQPEVVEFQGPR